MRRQVKSVAAVSAIAIGLQFGLAIAAEQQSNANQEHRVFTGVHAKRGSGGKPNTALIFDGKNASIVTEQEYRERGYIPSYDKLPVQIVRRLPSLTRQVPP